MRLIKKSIDPKNILNPGRVIWYKVLSLYSKVMAGNSFGNIFKISTFGESHGKALGGVIDGCPAGVNIDLDFINSELKRRRPGQSEIVTQRKEDDSVEFLSGIFEGKSTVTPIGFIIANQDQKSKDYSNITVSYTHLRAHET